MTGRKPASVEDMVAESRRLQAAGRFAEAERGYRVVLELDPRHAKARFLLGTLLAQAGHPAAGIAELELAIQLKPGIAAMYLNLGSAYLAAGRGTDAAEASRQAIRLAPNDLPDAYLNLGHALRDTQDWEGATQAYETYIRMNPTSAVGYCALGDLLRERGRLDAAMAAFETALSYAPDLPAISRGIADLMLRRGWSQAALVILERSSEGLPHDHEAQRQTAELRLMMENLETGWDDYDRHRFASAKTPHPRWPEPPPYWQGEELAGKTILVWNEQGPGDETIYAGILPDVIARAQRCAVACSPRMAPIFRRSFPDADVREWSGLDSPVRTGDAFDFQIAAGSLGRYLRRDFGSFPRHGGYLKADAEKASGFRRKYEELAQGRRIVGIAWKSKHRVYGNSKSTEPAHLGAILNVPGVMFVNLQYGDCAAEIAAAREALGVEIYQDPDVDPLADMDAFFAQVAAMDLVISTSNSTVHVAGSMNIPTWLLLPYGRGALWYWFLRREDSPWYPSMRIFRATGEATDAPWETEPGRRAGAELAAWVAAQPRAGH